MVPTTRRIVSAYSGSGYADLAAVLSSSAAQYCPQWEQTIGPMPERYQGESWPMAILARLAYFRDVVATSEEGDGLLLIDADTMILRSLNRVWERQFDLAYTVHEPMDCPWPVNVGVLFVRASERVVDFFDAWLAETRSIGTDVTTTSWRTASRLYGSADQKAFCCALGSMGHTLRTLALPCREWNCADAEWEHFTPLTRIVHVKGVLRSAIRGSRPSGRRARFVAPLVDLWRGFEPASELAEEAVA